MRTPHAFIKQEFGEECFEVVLMGKNRKEDDQLQKSFKIFD